MKGPTPDAIGRLVAARPLKELAATLSKTGAATASGLWGSSVAAAVIAVQRELNRPVMLICGHLDEADDLADDLELFAGRRPDVLPALELGGSLGHQSEEQVSNRLQLLARYAAKRNGASKGEGRAKSAAGPELLVAPVQAVMQSVPARQELGHLIRTIRAGDELEPEKLI